MTNAVLFDMDGVLIDSGPFHFESWKLLAAEHNLVADQAFFQRTFGHTNRYILPRFFGRELSEEEIRRFSDRKEALYREIIAGTAQPMPGLRAFIDAMRARGWRIGIGSSAPRDNVEFVLDLFDLRGVMAGYACYEDVTHGKPDPEVYLTAAARVGVLPARCVVVEDAIHGIEAARRAGMKCVALTTTNPRESLVEADLVVDSFEELDPERVTALLD